MLRKRDIILSALVGSLVTAAVATAQTYTDRLCDPNFMQCSPVGICPGSAPNPALCWKCTIPIWLSRCMGIAETDCEVITDNCGVYWWGDCPPGGGACVYQANPSSNTCLFESCRIPSGGIDP